MPYLPGNEADRASTMESMYIHKLLVIPNNVIGASQTAKYFKWIIICHINLSSTLILILIF